MSQVVTRKEAKAQGLKRYYTGKACPHGHYSERFVSTGQCLECLRVHCREQYWADPEYACWRSKQWAIKNPERYKSRARENYWANPDHHRRKSNEWKRRNRNYLRDYKRWRYHSTVQGNWKFNAAVLSKERLKLPGKEKTAIPRLCWAIRPTS